jgi:SNF2 family DNA or RNA helicase
VTTAAAQPVLSIDGKDILVRPPKYPSQEVKKELGGRWDKKNSAWRVAPISMNIHRLCEWYGEGILEGAPQPVRDLYEYEWGFPGFDAHPDLRTRAESHPRWDDLYPFQQEAVEYIVCNPHRGTLLGLSPGLGKTPVSVVAMDVLGLHKVLVLAPLTLARNWIKEAEQWEGQFRSKTRATAANKDPQSEMVVTNFETIFETILRDEDGNVYHEEDMVEWQHPNHLDEDPWVFKVTNARKVKEWIDRGPTKVNERGKRVPVRERIVQARRSYADSDWDLILIDESIVFKNRKAVKVDVVQQLTKYAQQVWLLSGSPTAKYRDDLFPQVQTIMPRAFTSYWRFAENFTIVERGQWGWSIEGDKPGVDLHTLLKDFLFVRDQKDVLPDLPEYIYRPLELSLNQDQAKAHRTMLEDWVATIEDELEGNEVEAPNRLAQMTRLQQITSNLRNLTNEDKEYPSSSVKEDALVALIENDEIEMPLLVWVNYVPTGESYAERLGKKFPDLSVKFVHGDATTQKKKDARDETLQAFKDGNLDVLILQYEVGKFGHTFTKTRTVYYGDRSWNSDSIVQSLRRVRRIGLTHSPVLITPRCPGTIDDLIEQVLEGKLRSIAAVSQADLLELLRSLGRQ